MRATRVFLAATGVLSIAAGAAYLAAPVALAALGGLELADPLGVIEVRGFYGGQLVGLGAFILLGSWQASFAGPTLLLVAAWLGGTALGRVVGIAASGSLPAAIAGVLAVEVLASGAALVLWSRERRPGA